MSGIMSIIEQLLIGFAIGGSWVYLGYRLGRSGPGLIEQIRAKRRTEYLYAATWAVAGALAAWNWSHRDHHSWWQVGMFVWSLTMVVYFGGRIRKATRLLNNPLIFLAALRYEFGPLAQPNKEGS